MISVRASLAPSEEILEECKILSYNGPDKINMLFFSDKNDAEEYTEFFLESNPLSKNKESFNFYYIDDYEVECDLYKGVAILCHNKEMIKKAASCPSTDLIMVIKKDKHKIRSSSYLGVLSINSIHPLTVFLHEFGHAFSNFAEEYITNKNPSSGSPNCQRECPADFDGEIDGCFKGCSQTTFYRSVEAGVMKTLQPKNKENPFGTFNSNIIQTLILERVPRDRAPITGQQIKEEVEDCSQQEHIILNTRTGETSVFPGCPTNNGYGPDRYTVTTDGQVISEGDFNLQIFTDPQETTTDTLLGETFKDKSQDLFLSLPLEGDVVEGFSEGQKIFEADISDAGGRPCQIS